MTKSSDGEYKEYCKTESDDVYAVLTKSQEEYDKQLLTLSTGLFAVILAFLKDIVHLDTAMHKPLLYLGLIALALTILLVIFSFQWSIFVLTRVREYWKEQYDGNANYEFPYRLGNTTTILNRASGMTFIAGIGFILAFIIVNLAR